VRRSEAKPSRAAVEAPDREPRPSGRSYLAASDGSIS
jgi:hypothetical protein